MTVSQTRTRTMRNSTHFVLAASFDSRLLRSIFVLMFMTLYVLMLVSNVLLVVVIWVNRSLHEPMYLFLCSLFVNELYGSSGLFPSLLVHVLRDVQTVSVTFCFLQIYCIHSYGIIEYLTLAVMSYDRYLAICHPLRYHTHMSRTKMAALVAVPWFYGFLACTVMISLTLSLQLCGNVISKIYCDNHSVVKLGCSDVAAVNVYGLIIAFINISVPLALIFYSYMRILKVCFSGSKQTRHKAVSTCAPHLASLLNFTLGAAFEIVQSRFNMTHLPSMLRIFLSLYFITCQPLFNPLMYGLNISSIRTHCRKLLFAQT